MRGAPEETADGKPINGVITSRWIPEKGDSGQLFGSVSLWLTPDFALGADYRPLVDKLSITSTWRILSGTPKTWKPSVILGTMADDFMIAGQQVKSRAFFGTLSQSLPSIDALNMTPIPYAGAAYINELDDVRPVGGITLRHKEFSLLIQYSGTDTHLSISRQITEDFGASFVLWGMEMPGIALRWRF